MTGIQKIILKKRDNAKSLLVAFQIQLNFLKAFSQGTKRQQLKNDLKLTKKSQTYQLHIFSNESVVNVIKSNVIIDRFIWHQ